MAMVFIWEVDKGLKSPLRHLVQLISALPDLAFNMYRKILIRDLKKWILLDFKPKFVAVRNFWWQQKFYFWRKECSELHFAHFDSFITQKLANLIHFVTQIDLGDKSPEKADLIL